MRPKSTMVPCAATAVVDAVGSAARAERGALVGVGLAGCAFGVLAGSSVLGALSSLGGGVGPVPFSCRSSILTSSADRVCVGPSPTALLTTSFEIFLSAPGLLFPAFPPSSFASDAEDCELMRLGSAGLLFAPTEAWNFFGAFFSLVPEVDRCISTPLPEDASSSSSSGNAKRAVGRGPDLESPRDFLRIGCGRGRGRVGAASDLEPVDLEESVDLVDFVEAVEASGLSAGFHGGARLSRNCVSRLGPRPAGQGAGGPGRKLTGGGSHRFAGPRRGTMVGPVEISSNMRASVFPLRCFLSLPHTCHQKFSSRFAVGSMRRRNVVVYTAQS